MPTKSINGYVELASPQTLDNNWRELNFDLSSRHNVMLDNTTPEWAGGYVYKDAKTTGSASHNRYIYWRSFNETLELVEMSSEVVLENNQVKIHFINSSVISSIDVIEFSDSVVIMIATLASVHRLTLPHPKMTDKSILDELNNELLINPSNYYILSTRSTQTQQQQPICAASWYDKAMLKCAVSYPDSSILIIQFSRTSHHVTTCEIKQIGIIGRLWSRMPNLLARYPNDCDNAVFACAPMYINENNDVLLITLCRDCKIRIFSTSTRECVLTHNMVPQSSFSQSFASHTNLTTELPMMKIYRSHVVVYLTETRTEFVILDYMYDNEAHSLKEVTTIHTPIWEKLIDFSLTDEKIWALANIRETESALCYTSLQSVIEESENGSDIEGVWDFVNLADESDPSLVRNLVSEIFWRNSFSVKTVQKALMGVAGPDLPKKDKMEELEELAFTRIVDSDQDEAWTRFYNYCLQNHIAANKTIGLVAGSDESVVGIIRRSNPTTICPWLMSVDLVLQGGPYRGIEFATCLRSVIEPLNYISTEILDDEMSQVFEEKLFETPSKIMSVVESTVKSVIKNKKISISKLYLSNKTLLSTGIDFICDQLDLTSQAQEFNEKILKGIGNNLRTNYTPLGSNSGILSIFQLFRCLVRARMILARDLLIYIHILDELSITENLPVEKRLQDLCEDLFITHKYRRIIDSLRCYATLVWLCETPIKAKPISGSTEIINFVASSFEFMRSASEPTGRGSASSVEVTIQRNLFMNFLAGGALSLIGYGTKIAQQAHTLSSSFYVSDIALDLCKLTWPKTNHLCVQEFMFTNKLDEHLMKHLDMTLDWVEHSESDRHFVRASNCLLQNRATQSVEIFNRLWMNMNRKNLIGRFIGIESDKSDSTDNILPVNVSLIYRYYERLVQLFQLGNNYQCLVSLINNCLSLLDENADPDQKCWTNSLRAKLFQYYLELEDSDEAYHTMVLTTDPSLRTNCLRKFIVSHCEKEQWSNLLSFPFIDIKDDFIEILDQRADSSDLSKLNEESFYKTSYYDLLFASYVSDEEYKRAAEVMYNYAQRLAHEVPGVTSIKKQTDCLLIALNSLRSVEEENAFIECNQTNQKEDSRGTVLKRSYDSEPESQTNGGESQHSTKILKSSGRVYCKDIETLYELTRARLRLLDKDQTSNAIALSPLRPEETIGQLVASSMFAYAIDLALLLKIRMESILEGLTAKYIFIMRLSSVDIAVHQDLDRGLSDIFSNSYSTIDTYNYIAHSTSRPIEKLWHLIDYYLNIYDGISHLYRNDTFAGTFSGSTVLMKVVAVKLLSAGYDIPASLRRMYLQRNTAELLKLLIKYDKLLDASDLAVEMIDKILEPSNCFAFASPFARNELPPVYLPTHLILLLITYLNEDATNKKHVMSGEVLTEKLKKFRSFLKADYYISTDGNYQ